MLSKSTHVIGCNRIEVLSVGEVFVGLGEVWIAGSLVRSGRLPLMVHSTSFSGLELRRLDLLGVHGTEEELRVCLRTCFFPAETKLMRDHSLDPIHNTDDWGCSEPLATGELDIVFKPAEDGFNGISAQGFSYHYEYRGESVELFYLLEKSSWELDGNIRGCTIVSQSACSDPLVTISEETFWTTEGLIHWEPDIPNPVMTHNLPRWASHQAFDFQWKADRVLLGVFREVGLIRSLLRREAHAAELKTFDKHIFDQSATFATVPKTILLTEGIASETAMRNFWTWVIEEVHDRARAEFGLKQEPTLPRLAENYWRNFNYDSYFKDLVPAAIGIGIRQIFIDNVNRSAMSEGEAFGNMCCGHEYEPAPALGGEIKLKELIDRCEAAGIQVMSWTNNDQAYTSPLNRSERDEKKWYVKMEDTRTKFGGAYSNVFSIFDFSNEEPRQLWVNSLKKIHETTGLNGYLFDSFYNLGFMPVNYADGKPRTMWRQLLAAFKELQDADVHFLIESFGPFGQVQHGCPRSYNIDRCWVCYEIGVGDDYTTVPSTLARHEDPRLEGPGVLYFILAHKTVPPLPLTKDGRRIDSRWTESHKRALRDYHEVLPLMKRRYLQADGKSVVWHSDDRTAAVIWSFEIQTIPLEGTIFDVTSGRVLPEAAEYTLEPLHTYRVKSTILPVELRATNL